MLKTFDYDTIQIGEVLGQKQVEITDEMIRSYCEAIETSHPWYLDDSPFGGRIAPATIFGDDTLRILDEQYARFGSIHAKQAWEFTYPARLGHTVTLTVTVVDKFVRRERPYIVMEMAAVDDEGIELCRSLHTSLMTLQRGS